MATQHPIDDVLPNWETLVAMLSEHVFYKIGEQYEREILSEARPHEYKTRTGVVLTVVEGDLT